MPRKLSKRNEKDYEYEIYIDNKLVWHGLSPEKIYDKIVKKIQAKRYLLLGSPKREY